MESPKLVKKKHVSGTLTQSLQSVVVPIYKMVQKKQKNFSTCVFQYVQIRAAHQLFFAGQIGVFWIEVSDGSCVQVHFGVLVLRSRTTPQH